MKVSKGNFSSNLSVLGSKMAPIYVVALSRFLYCVLKTMLLFILELSSRALDDNCCWLSLGFVPGLPHVFFFVYLCLCFRIHILLVLPHHPWFPIISYTYFPVFSMFSYYFLYVLIKSDYLVLISTRTSNYRCLIIIFLSPVTMTLNRLCLLIVCCDGFQ